MKLPRIVFAFYVMFAATIGCHVTVHAQGVVPDAVERAVLLDIFNATMSGLDTTNSQAWTPYRISRFPGVQLPGVLYSNGDITSITRNSIGMHGALPSQITTLTQLQSLLLSNNNLTSVPALDALAELKELNLSGNDFANVVFPSWLGDATSLTNLNLSYAQFIGPLPEQIGQLEDLQTLDLSGNNLSATNSIPSEFANLDALQTLRLASCSLVNASVEENAFDGLVAILSLNLDFNPSFLEVEGEELYFPSKVRNMPLLQSISLRGNGFTQFKSIFRTSLPVLNEINLSNTNYSNPDVLSHVIDNLKSFQGLRTIWMQACQIQGLPDDFDELDNIQNLYLDHNKNVNPSLSLDPALCSELGDMASLKILSMTYCDLSSLPITLSNSSSLRQLYVQNNNLVDLPAVVKEIPSLKRLNISANGIDDLPVWFGSGTMNSLDSLWARENHIETLPDTFTLLTNLKYLDLHENDLAGAWPSGFSNLSSIRHFDVSYNNITQLPDLTTWSALANVYVQRNKLKGIVPLYLTQATSNKVIVDMSDNEYNAAPPNGSFTSATLVNVRNNKFIFKDVIQLRSPVGYVFAPQDTIVDNVREVKILQPAPVTLMAFAADTLGSLNCEFQWFRYVDGVNDVALFGTPSHDAYRYTFEPTEADQGAKFYYKITHNSNNVDPDFPGLVLKSNIITVRILCESVPTTVDFSAKKYLCAMSFSPTVTYEEGCRSKSFDWNFGDGATSQYKKPLHAFGGAGTYTVNMRVQYTCGICVRDTVITKEINFSPSDVVLKDSVITVTTEQKTKVLAASAATFSDAWSLHHEKVAMDADGFSTGARGIWRNEGTFVYDTVREQSGPAKIATDGTFTLYNFNWAQAEIEAIPQWIKANTMTEYSAYSYELENRDVLGVYTAALYDYGGHLPSANGVNMRNREMAFTGFEFLDDSVSSGNWVFGSQPLPAYTNYEVYWGNSHMAIIKTGLANLENITKVDVSSRALDVFLHGLGRSNFIRDNEIICTQAYPANPEWSIVVLRKAPSPGIWRGIITVINTVIPAVMPDIDSTFAHSGRSSLKITSEKTFKQNIIHLDSGKTYFINAWVSVGNSGLATPTLGSDIGMEIKLSDKSGTTKLLSDIVPSGPIIEGWQQVKGTFTSPDNFLKLEIRFKAGSAGTVWYDDIRLHPEDGNMKCYVYDLGDYRLRAILDEENFASLFYYDKEGNLYLTKKETEEGIKTLSENVTYMKQTANE